MSADCQRIGDCEDARIQRLYEYLDGALTHRDLEEVRSHLEECPDCAHEYDLECIIRSVVRRSCSEKAPETLKVSIMTRISQLRVEAGH
ncbi:mycothiol system anti-sigma-R factor [Citricoccus sp. SGAir0253]|uniref:mycothiol system anti-sigma-R factor n=1 Tax=Citricoccus sp. SGAir0253 TaxID=2567881 RepID=UPI0010CD4735|nr:mycothiol system anti-sigma-R factor [Citricoccus sp. SGAir0253]QCU78446.1 mycothiol system anti-sigma-R factor [Citricoccus sp. SGAir0253]